MKLDLDFLEQLLGFLGPLATFGSSVITARGYLKTNVQGSDEQSSGAEQYKASHERVSAALRSMSRSIKSLTPGQRFVTGVMVAIIFFGSAIIGLGLTQIVPPLVLLINFTAKLISKLPGIVSSSGTSPAMIPIAALVVLGTLCLLFALALFISEAVFYIATGVDIFYEEKAEKPKLKILGITCDLIAFIVLLVPLMLLPGDWKFWGQVLFIVLIVVFYKLFQCCRKTKEEAVS